MMSTCAILLLLAIALLALSDGVYCCHPYRPLD